MPEYLYAICSALLWAVSVPVISAGIRNPACGDYRAQVLAGLMISMSSGIIILSGIVVWLGETLRFTPELALAGLFTFPLATGIYYFAGVAFNGRADIAALFSKVKPLFSFILATLVLREPIDGGMIGSLTLIAFGTLLLLIGSGFRRIDAGGVLLGLATAALWSLGEYFMKAGVQDTHPVAANLSALIIGATVFIPFAIRPMRTVAAAPGGLSSLKPFLLHGILSFGLAYSMFFFSLEHIGLGRSVLINAFWPVIGIILTSLLRVARGKPIGLHPLIITAAVVLLCGSLLQAVTLIGSDIVIGGQISG